MLKLQRGFFAVIFLACSTFCLPGQSQANITGVWVYDETGTNEDFGNYSLTETLTVERAAGGYLNYTLISELVREYGSFMGWGERGTVSVSRPDIWFSPKEDTNDIFSDEWTKLQTGVMSKINSYRFELDGNTLVLTKGHERKMYNRQE